MNTTNCSQAKQELIPGMDLLIDHMKKQSLEIERLREENKELKKEVEENDADWNDWLNEEFGDELYPISPSPEPDEFVEKVKKLQEENKKLNDNVELFRSQNKQLCENATKLMEKTKELDKSNEFLRKSSMTDEKVNKIIQERISFGNDMMEIKDRMDKLLYGDKDGCPYVWDHEKENNENNFLSWEQRISDVQAMSQQIDELGELCENIDKNAYNSWKKITGNEDEESSDEEEEEEEKVKLDWICYEFVRYDYDPEDGSVYDTDGTKIADWDDQGDGKMLWVDKKYKKKHNRLAKKSMDNIVAMATAPVN